MAQIFLCKVFNAKMFLDAADFKEAKADIFAARSSRVGFIDQPADPFFARLIYADLR